MFIPTKNDITAFGWTVNKEYYRNSKRRRFKMKVKASSLKLHIDKS